MGAGSLFKGGAKTIIKEGIEFTAKESSESLAKKGVAFAIKESDDLAFGLSTNLDEFSSATGFKNYKQFTSGGFKPNEIEQAIKNSSNNLHFNLTDFTKWKYMKYSNNPTRPTLGNITNRKLFNIYNISGALERTKFYKFINGSYQVVPKPF
ncbi:hypothetical protein [Edaphocola flava]|uniref:hypothetical protein n=1 Tax=Edaphocola flava TaxID=2499629 RepID=UPI00100B1E15|nr:hypothetical protein [Edaphocola flava]